MNAKNGRDTVNHAILLNDKTMRVLDMSSSSTKGIYSDPNLSLLMICDSAVSLRHKHAGHVERLMSLIRNLDH
jgi:hypothetical protein